MLQQVIEAEVEASSQRMRSSRTRAAGAESSATVTRPSGRSRPASARSRCADRRSATAATAPDGARIRFTSKVLPPFLRRTKNVEELLPWLYLKGVSTGQFEEALAALLAPTRPGSRRRPCAAWWPAWQQEHERWQRRDLGTRRYVYLWADGVYFTPRLDHDRQCILVLIGADADGRKELLAIEDGYRESTQSWRELLLRAARRERPDASAPELATATALSASGRRCTRSGRRRGSRDAGSIRPPTSSTPCRKSVHGKAKKDLHAIYEAESRAEPRPPSTASSASTARSTTGGDLPGQGSRGAARLLRLPGRALEARAQLEPHREHLRHRAARTDKTKGCLSRETALAMVFKLAKSAERHWRRLDGANRLGQLIEGIRFRDGEAVQDAEEQAAA